MDEVETGSATGTKPVSISNDLKTLVSEANYSKAAQILDFSITYM